MTDKPKPKEETPLQVPPELARALAEFCLNRYNEAQAEAKPPEPPAKKGKK